MRPALDGRGLVPPRRDDSLFGDVLRGLASRPRALPTRWLWDERGMQLHQRLAAATEHYVERAERALIEARRSEIAARLGRRVRLVEVTPLDVERSRALFEALDGPREYVPIAPSSEQGEAIAAALRRAGLRLSVSPRVPDVGGGGPFGLCAPLERALGARVVVWISAAHLGSVEPHEATAGLASAARLAGEGGLVLVGADGKKAKHVIEAAYDDRRGTAAAFHRNALVRLNRELGTTFDVTRFTYRAPYDPIRGRVEMRMVSDVPQRTKARGHDIELGRGEWIVCGRAYKHDDVDVVALARRAGLALVGSWADPERQVSIHLLARRGGAYARA